MIADQKSLRAALMGKFPRNHGQLLPSLHYLQREFGYLPDWAMEVVGWHLGIPASEVYGAATSYTELRIRQPGEHTLRVCMGLSCRMNGGDDLLSTVSADIHANPGETTTDGKITFEETSCGFLCAMAPAVEWDGKWIGRATTESVRDLFQEEDSS